MTAEELENFASDRTWGEDAYKGYLMAVEDIKNGTLKLADLSPAKQEPNSDYWEVRCLAAEKFIIESQCDPDITKSQILAYNAWRKAVDDRPALPYTEEKV